METLRIRLFGHLAVEVEGAWRDDWPRPAARRLVALLAISPSHVVGREALVEHLFAHLPVDRALRNVSKALSQARTVVGSDRILADASSVSLAGPVETDLALAKSTLDNPDDIQRVRTVLGSVDNLLLDDIYEEWAQPHRWELQAMARRACLEIARRTGAEEDWNRVVGLIPTNEEAWLALLKHAERQGASSVTETLRRSRLVWARETGSAPQHLIEAATQILAHLGPSSEETTVGREKEIAHIASSMDRGLPVLLVGPAGIGKTHLLRQTIARLEQGGENVAVGTSAVDDEVRPFSSIRSALLGLPVDLPAFLTGRSEANLSPSGMASQVALALMASSPTPVLILDDVHWADPTLKSLISALANQASLRRIRVLAAARSDEPNHPVPVWPSAGAVISLKPLGQSESLALGRRFLGAETAVDPLAVAGLAKSIASRSGGNPFFLAELARAASSGDVDDGDEVPERIAALLRERIRTLDPESSTVLRLVALAGEHASMSMITHLAGAKATSSLRYLRERGLLDSDALRLAHPLLRGHVMSEMNPVERGKAHRSIADVLSTQSEGANRPDLSVAATSHLLMAHQVDPDVKLSESTIRSGLLAGRSAYQSSARKAAIDILTATFGVFQESGGLGEELHREVALGLMDLARATDVEGNAEKAEEWIHQALAMTSHSHDRADAYRAWASIPYRRGHLEESSAILSTGLEEVDDTLAQATLEIDLAWNWYRQGRFEDAAGLLSRAAGVFEDAGDWESAASAFDYLGLTVLEMGRTEESVQHLDRALSLIGTAPTFKRGIFLMHKAVPLNRVDRTAEALICVSQGRRMLETFGDSYYVSVSFWIEAEVRESRGELREAVECRKMEIGLLEGNNSRHLERALQHIASLESLMANSGNTAGTVNS